MAVWSDRVALRVERGLRGTAGGMGVWGVSKWSEAPWSGIEPTWGVLNCTEIESLRIERGRSTATGRNRTGTAQLALVFRDGTSGAWSFRDGAPLELGMEVRVLASVDGGAWIPLYRGMVRAVADTWEPGLGTLRVAAGLVDRMAELAAVNLPALENPAHSGEAVDARLHRIADLAGVPALYRDFEASAVMLTGSTFARSMLDEAMVSVESEPGTLYADRSGRLVFRARDYYARDERSTTVQLTWSNGDEPETVAPSSFVTSSTLDDLANHISMARAGGEALTVNDPPSVARYGKRTHQRYDLLNTNDDDVETVAIYSLVQLARRTRRVDELAGVLRPDMPAELLAALVDVTLHDRHRLTWGDEAGPTFEAEFLVVGLTHVISSSEWRISPVLWDYASDLPAAGWGITRWDVDNWE